MGPSLSKNGIISSDEDDSTNWANSGLVYPVDAVVDLCTTNPSRNCLRLSVNSDTTLSQNVRFLDLQFPTYATIANGCCIRSG